MPEPFRLNPNAPVFIPMAPYQPYPEEFPDELWRKIYLDSFSHVFPEDHRTREQLRALKLLHKIKENNHSDGNNRNVKMVNSGPGMVKKSGCNAQEGNYEYDYERVLPDGDFLFHGFEPEEEEENYWNERNALPIELRDVISLNS
ncbi:hypothetical protein ZOSMA_141G00150 [Zostera marina]|uniref:Uncharacterized protein n=1 Tax=Zostera marina TaxID=29655 RepID=A0A0K9PXG4_ZOSMR|nr:hypothetical protein ZOSMA_141G00150 [Zostera marina]